MIGIKTKIYRAALISILSFGAALDAEAKQMIKIKADDEKKVWVSNLELNRVKAEGDRIKYLRANEGELEMISDKELGEIYIKPKEVEETHIFITTEKGYTYKIGLRAGEIAAEQIFLINEEALVKEAAKGVDQDKGDQKESLKLIKSMRHGKEVPEGYVEFKEKGSQRTRDVRIKKLRKFVSEKYIGEELRVKVKKGSKEKITEQKFYKEGVIAVSMDKELGAGEEGMVYIVRLKK